MSVLTLPFRYVIARYRRRKALNELADVVTEVFYGKGKK